jgi:hypothetical protein
MIRKVYDVKQKVLELIKKSTTKKIIQQCEYEQALRLYNGSLEISREIRDRIRWTYLQQ